MTVLSRVLRARKLEARVFALLVAAGGAAVGAGGAMAAPDSGPETHPARAMWLSAGALAGTTRFDPHLADYQWDVAPRPAWGLQIIAGRGRLGAGARLWQTETTQRTGLSGGGPDPVVHTTRWELVGEARLAKRFGAELAAVASAGRLHLAFEPDQVSVPVSGGGTVTVELKPVREWIGGGGVALRRALPGGLRAGVEIDHRWFGLKTAHMNGGVVDIQRESFGEWSAQLELARLFGRAR